MSLFSDYISCPVRTLSIGYSIDGGEEKLFCIIREILFDDMVESVKRTGGRVPVSRIIGVSNNQ